MRQKQTKLILFHNFIVVTDCMKLNNMMRSEDDP